MKKRVKIVATLFLILLFSTAAMASEKWTLSSSRDEMTGEVSWYAISPEVAPTKPMVFPYSDVTAKLCIGFDGKDEWAYFRFSTAPNLSDTKTKSGYNAIETRIKWDDEVTSVQLTQDWGAKFIHFSANKTAISKVAVSKFVLLELNWYGQGKVYFQFPLAGSSDAIKGAREKFR